MLIGGYLKCDTGFLQRAGGARHRGGPGPIRNGRKVFLGLQAGISAVVVGGERPDHLFNRVEDLDKSVELHLLGLKPRPSGERHQHDFAAAGATWR